MSDSSPGVVVLGAGHAGASVVGFLRQYGYQGKIILVGDEPHLPYHRPPLSKAWLTGSADTESAALRPIEWYEANRIELQLGSKATSIDAMNRVVALADGSLLPYEYLVIATGSRAILPPIPGTDLAGVQCLRTAADAERLKAAIAPGKHVAIVGGGYIGLEVAASAVALGGKATVIEREERLLARSASPLLAAYFAQFQRDRGVNILLSTGVEAFVGQEGRVQDILLSNGSSLTCDLAVIGVGAIPNMELAEAAGIACDGGIIVDAESRTNDPIVFAIGDVALRPVAQYGRNMRLESVANANEQARQTACAIVGRDCPPPEVTWNWSDQFDLKFQVAGLPFDVSRSVIRGNRDEGKFAIFHLNEAGQVQQVEAVNAPGEFMVGKKLIASRKPVSAENLTDRSIELKAILK